jgi:hypothetical protein
MKRLPSIDPPTGKRLQEARKQLREKLEEVQEKKAKDGTGPAASSHQPWCQCTMCVFKRSTAFRERKPEKRQDVIQLSVKLKNGAWVY